MLTEVNTETEHYYVDEHGRIQGRYIAQFLATGKIAVIAHYTNDIMGGVYKDWFENGQIYECSMMQENLQHGEFLMWNKDGTLEYHRFYRHNNNITAEVKAVVQDIENITDEERMLIKLTWGIECLPSDWENDIIEQM